MSIIGYNEILTIKVRRPWLEFIDFNFPSFQDCYDFVNLNPNLYEKGE